MAISVVSKRRRLRGLVLHRASGKHAVPGGGVPAQRLAAEGGVRPKRGYQGLHKASGPRLSGPYEKRAA